MFRVTPLSSTTMVFGFEAFLNRIVSPKLKALFPSASGLVPTFIIAENLQWADIMISLIKGTAVGNGLNITGYTRPSPTATDFSADINAAKAAGAKLVIQVFSSVDGASFIKQYGLLKPPFACVGINPETDQQEFWDSVSGACAYQTDLAAGGTRSNINPYEKPLSTVGFWDTYTAEYGSTPLYGGFGSYDTIISMNETSYDPVGSGHASAGKGWSKDVYQMTQGNITALKAWIRHTETLGVSDGYGWNRVLTKGVNARYYRSGMTGLFSFGNGSETWDGFPQPATLHDPYTTPGETSALSDNVTRAVQTQWQGQPDGSGRMEVVYPRDQNYSRKWTIPPWMLPNPAIAEADFASIYTVSTKEGDGKFYSLPDGLVNGPDLTALGSVWFKTPPYTLLEADMSPQDHFIDLYDLGVLGRAWTGP